MNYPIWELTSIGGPTLIAIIAVFHVFIAHIAVGGGIFIWLTDLKGFRENNPEIHRYLRKHTWFFLLVSLVLGAVTGVGIWFIIALVSPAATSTLIHNFVFGWAIEWVFFIGEIIALLVYHYQYDNLSRKQRLNIAFLYALFAWLSLFVINGIIGFMLTPGEWLASGNFWDGFFNPTYWPSLFFRTFIAFMFAGLFGYLTTVFMENESFRRTMLRYCTRWLLLPLIGLIPSAAWYVFAVPETLREITFAVNTDAAKFYNLLPVCTVAIFLLGILLSVMKGRPVQKAASFLLVPVGLLWMGGFEYTRENARKPFVIAHYMYSNSILVSDVDKLNREGVLKHAKWTAVKEVTADNRLEAGRELFNLECLACHTVNGVRNDVLELTKKFPYRGMLAQLTGQGKVNTFMPEFIGTQAEKQALAAYIVSELHGKEAAPYKLPKISPHAGESEPSAFDLEESPYLLLAWSDRGMRTLSDCDSRFSFAVPGVDIEAQLIKRGELPEKVIEGVEIAYKVDPAHSNPAAQVEFWKYAGPLTGGKNLSENRGLTGNGPEGIFVVDEQAELFRVEGIPLVPYREDGMYDPYPLIEVQARDVTTGQVLAATRVVAPVSTELSCYQCHGGKPRWKGVAGISEETAENILRSHDRMSSTSLLDEALAGKPRLCQSCHQGNLAGEFAGDETSEALSLSAAIHGWHANYLSDLGDETCMYCHPAAPDGLTRAFRGVHSRVGRDGKGLGCSQCHGTLEDHSLSLLKTEEGKPRAALLSANLNARLADNLDQIQARLPWVEEPSCYSCHGDEFEQPDPGAGGFNHYNQDLNELFSRAADNVVISCSACHGSAHALYPAVSPFSEGRDNLQPLAYGGIPYTVGADNTCVVCHRQEMEYPVHHENMQRHARNRLEGY